MDNFLEELESLTNTNLTSFNAEQSQPQQTPSVTNTPIQNPENYDSWHQTAAESQDYAELNKEIEADRLSSKVYVAVGSGLASLGGSAALGNWTLELTHNPAGYLIFSGVVATALISAGLAGSRVEGRRFYSSPWLLSSLGAAGGVVGGAWAVSRPYLKDQSNNNHAHEQMSAEIKAIEVKNQDSPDFSFLGLGVLGVLGLAIFMTTFRSR